MDAVVYAPRSKGSDAGAIGGDAGAPKAGASGLDGPTIYGCRAAGDDGAEAIFLRIVSMASEVGDWLRTDRACSTDGECRNSLLTPACNTETAQCVTCPQLTDRIDYNRLLVTCLADAIARCCVDPEAPQDCVFRDCVGGCGPQ